MYLHRNCDLGQSRLLLLHYLASGILSSHSFINRNTAVDMVMMGMGSIVKSRGSMRGVKRRSPTKENRQRRPDPINQQRKEAEKALLMVPIHQSQAAKMARILQRLRTMKMQGTRRMRRKEEATLKEFNSRGQLAAVQKRPSRATQENKFQMQRVSIRRG